MQSSYIDVIQYYLQEGSGGEPVDTPSEGVIDLDVVESEENPLEAFVGNWKLESQENFGEFLKAIGMYAGL